MWSPAEERQRMIEEFSDTLIDNDDYFLMDDPVPFLEWAADEYPNWTDINNEGDPAIDHVGMLYHWLSMPGPGAI